METRKTPLYTRHLELGGRMVPCPLSRNNPLGFARRFRSLLRGGEYDIVHSHAHHFSGFVLRLARQEHVPVRIAHCHNTSDGKGSGLSRGLYHALMRRWIWRHGTHGLAASEDAAQALFGSNWRSDARFRVLHCGIDLEPFRQIVSRAEVRSELGIPVDAPVVGHVGRFVPQKNHGFLLEVAAEVIKLRPAVRFLLIGDGPLRPPMEAKARQLGIEKSVVFAGARSDVPRLMLGAMDVFLFPSLWEGLGIAFLEAQTAGLRCVVSEWVPAEATIFPERVERVPLSGGQRNWVSTVLRALENGGLHRVLPTDRVAESFFSIARSAQALHEVYRNAVQRAT